MKIKLIPAAFGLVLILAAVPFVAADNLAGENMVLCSAVQVTVCGIDGECDSGLPWEWDVPQFVVIDLNKKTISTTEASGENRSSPLHHVQRDNGVIIVQGVENSRAFSAVLNEEFGDGAFSVALDGVTVSAFAACTPVQKR